MFSLYRELTEQTLFVSTAPIHSQHFAPYQLTKLLSSSVGHFSILKAANEVNISFSYLLKNDTFGFKLVILNHYTTAECIEFLI